MASSATMIRHRYLLAWLSVASLGACDRDLDEHGFQRRVEQAYVEVNPGFGVLRREPSKSTFARGDQTFSLDTGALYAEYRSSKKSAGSFLDQFSEKLSHEAKARRRSLEQAKDDVIPILKSGSWIRVQDLGAIGPPSTQEQIRPWRKELSPDLFVLLGVPEELLGYRYVSIREAKSATVSEDRWLQRAVANLAAKSKSVVDKGVEARGADQRLLVYELQTTEHEGLGALILDRAFRTKMLSKFQKDELGAAAPTRDTLIIFDAGDFVAMKPVRSRTHLLYDTQNHPGFRGLLRFDRELVSVLEGGQPSSAPVAEQPKASAH